jgi:hypothetical protein
MIKRAHRRVDVLPSAGGLFREEEFLAEKNA